MFSLSSRNMVCYGGPVGRGCHLRAHRRFADVHISSTYPDLRFADVHICTSDVHIRDLSQMLPGNKHIATTWKHLHVRKSRMCTSANRRCACVCTSANRRFACVHVRKSQVCMCARPQIAGLHVCTSANRRFACVHVRKSQVCMCARPQIAGLHVCTSANRRFACVHVRKSQVCMCARPQIADLDMCTYIITTNKREYICCSSNQN